ncbi:hypothetical protein QBC40DRAFT_324733 [Triangularia verruculosa]|uniref:Fe2OG dioxygenase domain-containing protein n=1 Tax=Triangularia verruculosa TaxID=2587418 RepID=A0AAN6XIT6_9PEZI|nr:hypothetical protein QBC40DRAFT_324733 [Triangularia verruculosa]
MPDSSPTPTFPPNLPLAPLTVISYTKLLANDVIESSNLLSACQNQGFFHLDLSSSSTGASLLSQSSQLYTLARSLFALPLETKQQFALQKGVSLFGYKPAGTVKATDPTHHPDSTEFFNIGKDDLFLSPPGSDVLTKKYPLEIQPHLPLLKSFTANCHALATELLIILARELGLSSNTALVNLNNFNQSSGDHIRLTHTTIHGGGSSSSSDKQSIGLPSHTDFGTVTILFNWQAGLQIESATATGQWEWVKPLPGHAIVNLGDAMKIFTNGHLKSAKHRVVPLPTAHGSRKTADRYSVVYSIRPNNNVLMKAVDKFEHAGETQVKVAGKFVPALLGETGGRDNNDKKQVLTAGEWMVQRAVQLGN